MKNTFPYFSSIISSSQALAMKLGHNHIGVEHFLLILIGKRNCLAVQVLESLKVDLGKLKNAIENKIPSNIKKTLTHNPPFNKEAIKILEDSYQQGKKMKDHNTNPEHLFLAILNHNKNLASIALQEFNVDYEIYLNELISLIEEHYYGEKMPFLKQWGIDYTQLAKDSKLEPIIGREAEIKRAVHVLSRRNKNNPILIGEVGVGKKSIIIGLAHKIVKGDVPQVLYNKRIIGVNIKQIMTIGAFNRFQIRIQSIMDEIKYSKNILLFIDNIHLIYNTERFYDVSNLAMSIIEPQTRVIGAFTPDEYDQHIKKNRSLVENFAKIQVNPPPVNEVIEILHQLKQKYEVFHGVNYSDEAIEACVQLSIQYMPDSILPGSAIDLLDEVGAGVLVRNTLPPAQLKEIKEKIEAIEEMKAQAVKTQQYEKAGELRNDQLQLAKQYSSAMDEWKTASRMGRIPVGKADVVEVLSLMSGISREKIK